MTWLDKVSRWLGERGLLGVPKWGWTTIVVLGLVGAYVARYEGFRVVPQPERITSDPEMRFKYGSMGAEEDFGIPYWIWVVLPRLFPEHLPGPGGYASLGFAWEPGEETPAGFAKKTMGMPRVTNNCAMCHTAVVRTEEEAERRFYVAAPGHTARVQDYIRFISAAAADPKFHADFILPEIEQLTDLSPFHKLMYRYLVIPITKKRLTEREEDFAWMEKPGWTEWGPGRDDPMNLTKYFMTDMPVDDTIGHADFPSIWNLGIREGHALNWGGETLDSRAVLIDSALGLGAPPTDQFVRDMEALDEWLKAMPPPEYPYAIDRTLAQQGEAVFERGCASCHGPEGARTGTVIPIDEIGTDRERLDTWSKEAADIANQTVADMGIERTDMVKGNGYVAQPLDGIWLRAPYLHNGSVPNLYALLQPPDERPVTFYRGQDVYDPQAVGFVADCAAAERIFAAGCDELKRTAYEFDSTERANGNGGHEYWPDEEEIPALVEYLKTQ